MNKWIHVEDVHLSDGTVISLEVREDGVRISADGWRRELARDDAVELAEALDRAATQWPPR